MNFNRPYEGPDLTASDDKRQLADVIDLLFSIAVKEADESDDS